MGANGLYSVVQSISQRPLEEQLVERALSGLSPFHVFFNSFGSSIVSIFVIFVFCLGASMVDIPRHAKVQLAASEIVASGTESIRFGGVYHDTKSNAVKCLKMIAEDCNLIVHTK